MSVKISKVHAQFAGAHPPRSPVGGDHNLTLPHQQVSLPAAVAAPDFLH